MRGPVSVVKLGGSLVSDAPRLRAMLARLADRGDGLAAVVPGGGPFAEAVREAQAALGFADPLAHRLALDAMGQMAEVFCNLEPRLTLAPGVAAVAEALERGQIAVWAPVELRDGHPDIPENWDVTSDSLALWLADRLAAAHCILIKSAPCPAGAGAEEVVALGLVDRAFPDFAQKFGGEIVLRGPEGDSRLHAHPEAPRSGLEGGPQGSPRPLEGSFEARLRLAPQDEGVGGVTIASSRREAAA